ncbi:hypothetical protein KIPB_004572 [Kipferlia bialata]|uniref:Rhodanese domain-containing protein n=1 Tax=Kipferlia bialata TaxID=797122 RepID=A0A9K3GHW5_9EUKA|nr:hypothetical protein KIPB_001699 [Kipferlia bialata]GIQ83277.1 hypothetical protein KIPB_004572 [Kipferlia bialata]|eukprot:g1699.t1
MESLPVDTVTYITASQLSGWLRDASTRASCHVVDVRQEDREAGWIKGSENVPIDRLDEQLEWLLGQNRQKSAIVFHCMYSQVRGPKAAMRFLSHCNKDTRYYRC